MYFDNWRLLSAPGTEVRVVVFQWGVVWVVNVVANGNNDVGGIHKAGQLVDVTIGVVANQTVVQRDDVID